MLTKGLNGQALDLGYYRPPHIVGVAMNLPDGKCSISLLKQLCCC